MGKTFWKVYEGIVNTAAVVLFSAMVLITAAGVFFRYVLNSPLYWTEEADRYAFIWLSFLGASITMRHKAHITVDVVVRYLPERLRLWLALAAWGLVLVFLAIIFNASLPVIEVTMQQRTTATDIPMGLVYLSLPVGCTAMAIETLRLAYPDLACVAGGAGVITALVIAFVVLLLGAVPVSFSMGLAGVTAIVLGGKVPLNTMVTQMVSGMDSFPLMAIPFFILAGELMERGGISERLVNLARALVGHIQGGLGMVVILGEYLFSGISGSTTADISAIGSLLIAPMERAGYSKGQAVAIVSSATAMGILVPPCIFMIVLASMTNQSIGAMFVAGFLPAIVIAAGLVIYIYLLAGRIGIPREKRATKRQLARAVGDGVIAMIMPAIIFGAIFGGIATVTEAAVVAVLYAAFVGLVVYRDIKFTQLPEIILASTINTAMVMFLVGTATAFSWLLTTERVPQSVAALVISVSSSPWVFLLISNIIFIVFGAVLEGLPAMIIFVPVMYPIATQFGIDPLHYGILLIASIGIGVFMPPIGIGLFVACAIAKMNIVDSARHMAPYLAILIIGLLVITYVPWFTLVLPQTFLSK